MREIKFRAWNREKKKLVYDFEATSPFESRVITFYPARDCMQFTGFEDSNGVDIYEGDLLEHSCYKKPVIVTWNADMGCYKFGGVLRSNLIKVIGNIHENPELLEVE